MSTDYGVAACCGSEVCSERLRMRCAIFTQVTRRREKPMTAVPRKRPQIMPKAIAYRVSWASPGGENRPLTNWGEVTETSAAKRPPRAAETNAAAKMYKKYRKK